MELLYILIFLTTQRIVLANILLGLKTLTSNTGVSDAPSPHSQFSVIKNLSNFVSKNDFDQGELFNPSDEASKYLRNTWNRDNTVTILKRLSSLDTQQQIIETVLLENNLQGKEKLVTYWNLIRDNEKGFRSEGPYKQGQFSEQEKQGFDLLMEYYWKQISEDLSRDKYDKFHDKFLEQEKPGSKILMLYWKLMMDNLIKGGERLLQIEHRKKYENTQPLNIGNLNDSIKMRRMSNIVYLLNRIGRSTDFQNFDESSEIEDKLPLKAELDHQSNLDYWNSKGTESRNKFSDISNIYSDETLQSSMSFWNFLLSDILTRNKFELITQNLINKQNYPDLKTIKTLEIFNNLVNHPHVSEIKNNILLNIVRQKLEKNPNYSDLKNRNTVEAILKNLAKRQYLPSFEKRNIFTHNAPNDSALNNNNALETFLRILANWAQTSGTENYNRDIIQNKEFILYDLILRLFENKRSHLNLQTENNKKSELEAIIQNMAQLSKSETKSTSGFEGFLENLAISSDSETKNKQNSQLLKKLEKCPHFLDIETKNKFETFIRNLAQISQTNVPLEEAESLNLEAYKAYERKDKDVNRNNRKTGNCSCLGKHKNENEKKREKINSGIRKRCKCDRIKNRQEKNKTNENKENKENKEKIEKNDKIGKKEKSENKDNDNLFIDDDFNDNDENEDYLSHKVHKRKSSVDRLCDNIIDLISGRDERCCDVPIGSFIG